VFACSHFGITAESLPGNHQQLVTIATMDPMQATQACAKLRKAQARRRKAEELVKKAEDLVKKEKLLHQEHMKTAKTKMKMAKKMLKQALKAELNHRPLDYSPDYSLFADDDTDDC
jgi:multidrug resistance efflux pump